MKVLVTGGAGFIGSNLVDRLIELKYEVIVIDNESAECNEKFYWNDKSDNYKLDICDYENTRRLYNSVDYVFHLAAESRLQPAINNPINAVTKNVVGTCTVLQCSRESGVKKVLYSSTSSAYGLNKFPNIETDPNDCLNPYSASKVAGEELCKMYTNLYGLKTIIFRYFNVYGERSPTIGQYAPVIGIFLRQFLSGESLTIVGDGHQRRDFVHVRDVVNANIMSAISNINDEHYGQVYNIGSGENISILEIAKLISSDYIHIPPRDGEARTTLACIDKFKKVFGWTPKIKLEKWIEENYGFIR
jgi:UDP-glucose 4-epimerase